MVRIPHNLRKQVSTRMFIIGLGTAAPACRYTQAECWAALQESARVRQLLPRSRALLKKVLHNDNGIISRHLALEKLDQAFSLTPDALHARFKEAAPALAARAAMRALADSKSAPAELDALLISTCTGFLCPGLTSYVSEKLGLRPDIVALDLVGQGCGAALPNLHMADALLASGKCRRALSICVEVCSAAFYLDDDPGVLVSACLFGDGAGAAVLSDSPGGRRPIKWKHSQSLLHPAKRDVLRFDQKNGMLRNILTPQVPSVAGQLAESVFSAALARSNTSRSQITGWVLHPGGRDVLTELRGRLGLGRHEVRWSEAVLREYGNVSSPSVFFVLQRTLCDNVPSGLWWMSSFGAGLSCHGALLEVQ